MRRFAVRQRPLQPSKRIRVYHLAADGSFISETGERVAANLYDLDDCSPEKASFLTKARISIPKPPISTIPNYDSEVSHSFKRSNGFIKYIPLTVEEEENKVEYNLDYNDEMWIRKHKIYGDSAPEPKQISVDLFERMLDCTDKYCGEHKSEPTADILETLFMQKLQFNRIDSHEVCKMILDYWKKKRKELGKPLLRRYWPLTNINDTNPNLVFRPRGRDEHYRLRKKNKPIEEVLTRLLELKTNLEHGRVLCQLTHKREQLKLKKLMYIYETVVEVHYLLTNHSGPRTLTYNLKDMFVYEGRTSSILSASASANAYATFNPLANRSFGENRFNLGLNSISDIDELTVLTSTPVNHISTEEKHYLQLLSLAQLGGSFQQNYVDNCEVPSVVINQAGTTPTTGINWLLPVSAKDNYSTYYDPQVSNQSYCTNNVINAINAPTRIRLRGRISRNGRIVIDQLKERKPLYGDQTEEIYRACLPMSAVRHKPETKKEDDLKMNISLPDIAVPGLTEVVTPPVIPFNRVNPECATSVKRSYQEVMQDFSLEPYCNFDNALSFNLSNEMTVHADSIKRLIINRNTMNDQKRTDFKQANILIARMYTRGRDPLKFQEERVYYNFQTERRKDILQFANRLTNEGYQYSIRYRGMTSHRRDNIRVGIGEEYDCSSEGGGLIQEMGFIPIKKKLTRGNQWCIGNGIYLKLYEITKEIKGKAELPIDKNIVYFELYTYCENGSVDDASKEMLKIIRLLQP